MEDIKSYIKNSDCFDEFKNINDNTVDLVCVDLPYGQTDCKWDSVIDLSKMWIELKRICKEACVCVFFCTTKFGYKLIQSNERWFRYDLVWEKSKALGFLNCNKLPLRKHEMIYIFSYSGNDLHNERNIELRQYAKKVKKYINTPKTQIYKLLGNRGIQSFYCFKTAGFRIPTKKNYNKLIEHFKINEMKDYMKYEEMKKKWENSIKSTYNPQKTKGKPYKTKGSVTTPLEIYGKKSIFGSENKTGDRYPVSIIKFNNPKKSIHRTQKPVSIIEWIIKTYSNENDLVLDFTMGSGSTVEACINTNRKYIGIEKDKDIFLIAKNRIDNLNKIK